MPNCAFFRNFCLFLRTIFVYIDRREMHFKKSQEQMCVCVYNEVMERTATH